MRCSSYYIGNALDLARIVKYCKQNKHQHQSFNDVVHVKAFRQADIFYFKNGTMVTWNINKKISRELAKEAEIFSDESTVTFFEEHFVVLQAEKTSMRSHRYFNVEMIFLESDDDEIKLAISYGLAHSVKLSFYQRVLSDMTDKYSILIKQLAETGRTHLKQRQISKIVGNIFWVRSLVNLRGEYLHVPNYFWQHVNLESTYLMVERYMDIAKRVSMLNQKLDILNEIFNILSNELQHQHSAKLEWIIIILICVEILFSLLSFLK